MLTISATIIDGQEAYLITSDGLVHWLDGCDADGIALPDELMDRTVVPTHFGTRCTDGIFSADFTRTVIREIRDLATLEWAYSVFDTPKMCRVWFPREALEQHLKGYSIDEKGCVWPPPIPS